MCYFKNILSNKFGPMDNTAMKIINPPIAYKVVVF